MKKRTFIINLIIPLLVGGLSALLTRQQMETYMHLNKPLLSPPGWLFPIVWTFLYILMGISSYMIYISQDDRRENTLIIYAFQLFINFCWPLFFFNLHNYFIALMILLVLIVTVIYMMILFKQINKTSFYLNIPYIIWLFFALYLNFMIFINN
nr:TspO/MBR family protein [uncultured Faecalibacillus sp.]